MNSDNYDILIAQYPGMGNTERAKRECARGWCVEVEGGDGEKEEKDERRMRRVCNE